MVIVETSVFTRQLQSLLSDDEYPRLQLQLSVQPELAPVIVGSGGLRKARWSVGARGKRGGLRVIYYWASEHERLLMLLIDSKSRQDDLTPDQLKVLRQLIEGEYPCKTTCSRTW